MNKFPICFALAAVAAFPQAQTPLTITQSAGSATGELRMQERRTNGTDYVGLKAPQSVAPSVTWTLPAADGTAAQCLQTDGAGVLSFAACAGYWTLSGSDIYRSTGLVTIGHTAATVRLGQNLNTNKASDYGGMALNTFSATGSHGSVLDFNKSASGTLGAHGAVSSGDTLGFFAFRGSDGANYQRAAEVNGEVDGTVSSGVVPGRIRFRTANSSGTMTESWRIDKDGAFRPGADDTFDIGLTGTRVRGVYSKFGQFYKSGGTASSDYLTTRKYNILDQSGGSGAWDIQASGSMASTSSIKIRDNAGSRWLEAYRAIAGTPLKYTSLFGHLYPAKRLIADGDAVDDSVFGDLGASTARWANVWGATANLTALTIPTGSTTGYVWTDTGSGVGAWQAGGLDAYDVRNFGAVCNGVADDTTAIQSAIAAAIGIKGIVLLPQGTCIVSTLDITSSFRGIRGQGINVTRLRSVTNAPIIRIDTGTGGSALNFYNLEFSNMTIMGDGVSSGQYAFEVKGDGSFNNSDFHHLWIEQVQIAVYAHLDGTTGSGHNKFHENWFSLGNTNAIGIYRHAPEGSGWMISGNDFGGAAGSIGDTSGARGIVMRNFIGDLMINDNHMEGGWVAVDLSCDDGKLPKSITAGTNANPVSLTATAHGRSGTVTVSLNGFTGSWAALNGEWTATVTGSNTFTVPVNSTGFGAMTGTNAELTSSGACAYGNQIAATGNKIDGYTLDGRLYNVQNSSFTGNRGRGILREQIRGDKSSLAYDQMGQIDTGSAIVRTGLEYTTSYGNLSLNAYDEGRIRIGVTTSNISNARNGISIQDQGASSAIALGQSATRNMGMLWNYNATAGSAYGLVYTYSYSNPMLYGASSHQFVGANGPALGAGQNISPVWVSGTSGFIGYGLYRTDDTNGGWLIGTSGVSVGDFAIYQNQGAGSPARRFRIESSGGAVDMTSLKIGGTTAIDSSRNGSFAGLSWTGNLSNSITFSSGSTYNVGSSGAPPLNVYGNYIEPITALVLSSGTRVTGDIVPSSSVTYSLGYAANKFSAAYVTNMYIYGAVQAPSGSIGASSALSCGSGQAIKAITVDAGIVTSVSCGTP